MLGLSAPQGQAAPGLPVAQVLARCYTWSKSRLKLCLACQHHRVRLRLACLWLDVSCFHSLHRAGGCPCWLRPAPPPDRIDTDCHNCRLDVQEFATIQKSMHPFLAQFTHRLGHLMRNPTPWRAQVLIIPTPMEIVMCKLHDRIVMCNLHDRIIFQPVAPRAKSDSRRKGKAAGNAMDHAAAIMISRTVS